MMASTINVRLSIGIFTKKVSRKATAENEKNKNTEKFKLLCNFSYTKTAINAAEHNNKDTIVKTSVEVSTEKFKYLFIYVGSQNTTEVLTIPVIIETKENFIICLLNKTA